MDTWNDPNGSEIDSGCVLTTSANDAISHIHHRMPVVIKPNDFEQWLDCKTQEPKDIMHLMQPIDEDYFEAIPVGDAVNKVANSSADIQQRVDPKPRNGSLAKNPITDQMDLF